MARNYGRSLSLEVDGVEVKVDLKKCRLTNEPGDVDFGNPTRVKWSFELEGYEDHASGSLWSFIWTNSGETVPFVFAPYGNAAATTTQPHYTGNVTIGSKPAMGGEVNNQFTFEATWEVDGEITKVTA